MVPSLQKAGRVLNLYKQMGETPRERLERLRRLDPMAEGVLVCLVGAANQRRDAYLDLNKEYVLDVLFGFSTDTYDFLGRVIETGDPTSITRQALTKGLNEFRGHISQEYPPFSSKTVEGKSLFEWARSLTAEGNALGTLVLPHRSVTIHEITLRDIYKVGEPELLHYIEQNVERVSGDFRQEEIIRLWRRHLKREGDREFPCATIHISCSSGTYARSIAHGLGEELGIPALALHILRTKVGDFDCEKSLK
jgi:tRNA pseudouridine55 synthase